jgi:hypothetical protein
MVWAGGDALPYAGSYCCVWVRGSCVIGRVGGAALGFRFGICGCGSFVRGSVARQPLGTPGGCLVYAAGKGYTISIWGDPVIGACLVELRAGWEG